MALESRKFGEFPQGHPREDELPPGLFSNIIPAILLELVANPPTLHFFIEKPVPK
jgi:hypothetical protein